MRRCRLQRWALALAAPGMLLQLGSCELAAQAFLSSFVDAFTPRLIERLSPDTTPDATSTSGERP